MSPVIQTEQFQKVPIENKNVIVFPQGIMGLEGLHEFVLIDRSNKGYFLWLQSVEKSDICFLTIDPKRVIDFFDPKLSREDLDMLKAKSINELIFLSIVNVDDDNESISVNLKSPIAVNGNEQLGSQIVLNDDKYLIQYALKGKIKSKKNSKSIDSSVVKTLN